MNEYIILTHRGSGTSHDCKPGTMREIQVADGLRKRTCVEFDDMEHVKKWFLEIDHVIPCKEDWLHTLCSTDDVGCDN